MKITILGAGAYGSALGAAAQKNNHEVAFYDPSKYPDIPLSTSVKSAEAIVLCVPSSVAESVLQDLSKTPGTHNLPLICATKGLLSPAIFSELGFKKPIVSSGAGFASEFSSTKVFLTTTSPLAEKLFGGANVQFDYTSDLTGVMLCGTLKNIFAIAAGWHNLTDLPKAQQITEIDRYVEEFNIIIAANGGDRATANLNCGRRDIILTCLSKQSRNYQLGQKLAKITDTKDLNKSNIAKLIDQTTEGWTAAQRIASTPSFMVPKQVANLRKILALAA